MKYLLSIVLLCVLLAGCEVPEPTHNSNVSVNESYSLEEQNLTSQKENKFLFEVNIKKDVNNFLVAVNEETEELTNLYTDPVIREERSYVTSFNKYNVRYPIARYIFYSFLIQLPDIKKENVMEVMKYSFYDYFKSFIYKNILCCYNEYYSIISSKLIPSTYYKKHNTEKEEVKESFEIYNDMFLEELNSQISAEKVDEIENYLFNIFTTDQTTRRKAFLTEYGGYIKHLYNKEVAKIKVKAAQGPLFSCIPNDWDEYSTYYDLVGLAKSYKVTPYTLVFGSSYEKRKIYIEPKVAEALEMIRINFFDSSVSLSSWGSKTYYWGRTWNKIGNAIFDQLENDDIITPENEHLVGILIDEFMLQDLPLFFDLIVTEGCNCYMELY